MLPRSSRLLLATAVLNLPAIALAAAPVSFNRDIRPILSDNCFACHGPDANKRKAKRRLDTFAGATAERNEVRAIVPGDLENSDAWLRITSTDENDQMPPPDSHKALTSDQKETLRRWIIEGARYESHWAYSPPRHPPPPAVKNSSWVRNDLDRFILARLEREHLVPSPEADQATLLRRVSLDLTGLPPTPAEVAAFNADQDARAYERVVDRLLRSPHYGERMALGWLDAARYADTNGYQIDRDREIWAWRDWVVGAYNANMPFDQFVIEQLAGDLLPQATLAQRIATGFNRNNMFNEEGGIIPAEFLAEYTADRVETTATVFLGQTFMCARCHDHKFDPITQRDFYSLKAFFHNVPELGKAVRQNGARFSSPPFVRLPSPQLDARLAALHEQQSAARSRLAALTREYPPGLDAWVRELAQTPVAWQPLSPTSATAEEQKPEVDRATDAVLFEYLNNVRLDTTVRVRVPRGRVTALRITCAATNVAGTFRWTELRVQLCRPGAEPVDLPLRAAVADDSLAADVIAPVLDGTREARVALAVKKDRARSAVFELATPLDLGADAAAELACIIGSYGATSPTRWTFEATAAAPAVLVPAELTRIAGMPAVQRPPADQAKLAAHFVSLQPASRQVEDEIAALQREILGTERDYSTTLVMEEMDTPRETFILLRGAYDKPGERVTAETPAFLPPMAPDLPRNRLGLARWLVSPGNPLTARVAVNRLWQTIFGTGLVKTSEDFGSQGEPPSHPELLDWLATEFVRTGWDVKRMLRLLVTSAVYRQQSRFTPGLLERDPENRLLARAPRYRLPVEFVRDQALAVSALLVPTLGGPPVRPYHPAGLYEGLASTSEDVAKTYQQSHGDDLHRRTLYTYWKRSVPHPAMLAFDVPFRETCTVRRTLTNTPAQALVLMNDPTFVEAARGLAQRMMREGGADPDARLAFGFRLVLVRDPRPAERIVLRRALDRARADFARDPLGAKAFLQVGEAPVDPALPVVELAAYATVASTLLCRDETITKP